MKLTSRHNTRFSLPGGIEAVIVRAGQIAYLEVEIMSTTETVKTNRQSLVELCERIGVTEFLDRESFDDLCSRLSRDVDVVIGQPEPRGSAIVESLRRLLDSPDARI